MMCTRCAHHVYLHLMYLRRCSKVSAVQKRLCLGCHKLFSCNDSEKNKPLIETNMMPSPICCSPGVFRCSSLSGLFHHRFCVRTDRNREDSHGAFGFVFSVQRFPLLKNAAHAAVSVVYRSARYRLRKSYRREETCTGHGTVVHTKTRFGVLRLGGRALRFFFLARMQSPARPVVVRPKPDGV